MRSFPFVSILLLIGAAVCFVIFIMFNYAFNNPGGLFTLLDESAAQTMNAGTYSWFNTRMDHIQTGFGLSGVVLLSLGIISAIAAGFKKESIE